MVSLPKWVRLPSRWIEADSYGLRQLHWSGDGAGSDNIAALMVLAVIAHHSDSETGLARLTYDTLCKAAGLSRAKASNGLDVLDKMGVVMRTPAGRSTFQLTNFDPSSGWARLPAKNLYHSGRIRAFDNFHLRAQAELNAMKLYFLFAARRDRKTNMAKISFEKIELYAGIQRNKIKEATSLLAINSLAYADRILSENGDYNANAYRLVHLEPYTHLGTKGRAMDEADSEE